MKKIISMLLLVAMMVSLVACQSNNTNDNNDTNKEPLPVGITATQVEDTQQIEVAWGETA